MTRNPKPAIPPLFLGIECGATRTVAIVANNDGQLLQRIEAGPANLRLIADSELLRLFRGIAGKSASPSAIGVGMAGVRGANDEKRVIQAANKVWPKIPCAASHDLETALSATDGWASGQSLTRVVVLSGTGSCCYGRRPEGKTAKVGGWGHLLGDKGSGYEIGLRSLKAVVYYYDRDGVWPALGQKLLRAAQLNEPEELIGWAQNAEKKDIAALAVEVFAACAQRDKIARDILEGAASSLAKDAVTCAQRLVRPGTPVQFVFTGSVLLKQPRFAKQVTVQIRRHWPKAQITPLKVESVWGAIRLARRQFELSGRDPTISGAQSIPNTAAERSKSARTVLNPSLAPLSPPVPTDADLSPTERRNPRSMHLHQLPLLKAISLMLDEESKVPRAVLAERKKIAWGIRKIVQSFQQGGRLFYVGAGTSGRLGVLDASECPPTFRAPPDQVQGIIAGGQQALWKSAEGAEDDLDAGARAIRFRRVRRRDVVVGIAASGRTPFVWGALGEAKRRRATTILLCFHPQLKVAAAHKPSQILAPDIGPEVLTGSTRLKAGTATKLILNLFTTLSMVRLGKVMSNLMVDLKPANSKLRDRAVRIVQELTGANYSTSRQALEGARWIVKSACERLGWANPKPFRAIRRGRQNGRASWTKRQ